jgi:hypothetical protein
MGKGDLAPMDKANMSKERPILFSALMVKALLEGSKTQTRRIVKPRKSVNFGCLLYPNELAGEVNNGVMDNCPWRPGGRLWVRETWQPAAPRDGTWPDVSFYGCKTAPLSLIPERYQNPENCLFRASWQGPDLIGWKPSIFMPRWASRITLEIVNVRVEKLQDISDEDAIAEGIPRFGDGFGRWHPDPDDINYTGTTKKPVLSYMGLWEYVNGPGSWDKNPWVWVIEFKIVRE